MLTSLITRENVTFLQNTGFFDRKNIIIMTKPISAKKSKHLDLFCEVKGHNLINEINIINDVYESP